jgi:NCS1 family nucleobase:cation symporter-1
VKLLGVDSVPPLLTQLYNYAWFIGFAVAFAVYLGLRKIAPKL